METWVRVCRSWEEEAEADREYWLRFSPEERVAIVDTLREQWSVMRGQPDLHPTRNQADFLDTLSQRSIRALVTGVHALAFYAKPRYCETLEVFVESAFANVANELAPTTVKVHGSLHAVTFAEGWKNRVEGRFRGRAVFFISSGDLQRNLGRSAAHQDLADADLLRRFL